MGLSLKQKDTNTIFETSIELLKNFTIFNKKWLLDATLQTSPNDVMDFTFDIAYQHFLSYRSTYRQKTTLRRNKNFVEPVERAIGTRWEQKKMKLNGRTIHIPRLIQSTLTYIPILETLKSLFMCEEFAALYFKYNQSNGSNLTGRKFFRLIRIVFNYRLHRMHSNHVTHYNPNQIDTKLMLCI